MIDDTIQQFLTAPKKRSVVLISGDAKSESIFAMHKVNAALGMEHAVSKSLSGIFAKMPRFSIVWGAYLVSDKWCFDVVSGQCSYAHNTRFVNVENTLLPYSGDVQSTLQKISSRLSYALMFASSQNEASAVHGIFAPQPCSFLLKFYTASKLQASPCLSFIYMDTQSASILDHMCRDIQIAMPTYIQQLFLCALDSEHFVMLPPRQNVYSVLNKVPPVEHRERRRIVRNIDDALSPYWRYIHIAPDLASLKTPTSTSPTLVLQAVNASLRTKSSQLLALDDFSMAYIPEDHATVCINVQAKNSAEKSMAVILPGLFRDICSFTVVDNSLTVLKFPFAQIWLNGESLPQLSRRSLVKGDILVIGSLRYTFIVQEVQTADKKTGDIVYAPSTLTVDRAAEQIAHYEQAPETQLFRSTHLHISNNSFANCRPQSDFVTVMLMSEIRTWFEWFGCAVDARVVSTVNGEDIYGVDGAISRKAINSNNAEPRRRALDREKSSDEFQDENTEERPLLHFELHGRVEIVNALQDLVSFSQNISNALYFAVSKLPDPVELSFLQSVPTLHHKGLLDHQQSSKDLMSKKAASILAKYITRLQYQVATKQEWIDLCVDILLRHNLVPIAAMGWEEADDDLSTIKRGDEESLAGAQEKLLDKHRGMLTETISILWTSNMAEVNLEFVVEATIYTCIMLLLRDKCFFWCIDDIGSKASKTTYTASVLVDIEQLDLEEKKSDFMDFFEWFIVSYRPPPVDYPVKKDRHAKLRRSFSSKAIVAGDTGSSALQSSQSLQQIAPQRSLLKAGQSHSMRNLTIATAFPVRKPLSQFVPELSPIESPGQENGHYFATEFEDEPEGAEPVRREAVYRDSATSQFSVSTQMKECNEICNSTWDVLENIDAQLLQLENMVQSNKSAVLSHQEKIKLDIIKRMISRSTVNAQAGSIAKAFFIWKWAAKQSPTLMSLENSLSQRPTPRKYQRGYLSDIESEVSSVTHASYSPDKKTESSRLSGENSSGHRLVTEELRTPYSKTTGESPRSEDRVMKEPPASEAIRNLPEKYWYILDKNERQLGLLYGCYALKGNKLIVPTAKEMTNMHSMALKKSNYIHIDKMWSLFRDFGISPRYCSKMRLRSIYNELMDPDALDVPIDCLSFEEYLKVLIVVAEEYMHENNSEANLSKLFRVMNRSGGRHKTVTVSIPLFFELPARSVIGRSHSDTKPTKEESTSHHRSRRQTTEDLTIPFDYNNSPESHRSKEVSPRTASITRSSSYKISSTSHIPAPEPAPRVTPSSARSLLRSASNRSMLSSTRKKVSARNLFVNDDEEEA